MLGCGSHKFNQAIKNWVTEQPSLLRVIMNLRILMKKAGTLKKSATLKQYNPVVKITENKKTMAISVYHDKKSFFEIKWLHLESLNALVSITLSCVEVR